MYTKITRSGGRQYLQLVEGYRNDEGRSGIGSLPTSAGLMI
ncbi:hypothetical protein ACFFKB_25300 [Mameliella alba]